MARTPNSFLTADTVVVCGRNVLLIQRGRDPFQGKWALPGGFVDPGENVADAAARELQEETGVSLVDLQQFGAYGDPGRDPRGRTVSVVFWARLPSKPETKAGDDAANCEWYPIDRPPEMAFDHGKILLDVKNKLDRLETTEQNFLPFLDRWYGNLSPVSMRHLLKDYPADQTAVLCVDLVNGFTKKGNLASERIAAIIPAVVDLFQKAEQNGVNHYLLLQDNHPPHSKEFNVYPPHCVIDTEETHTVRELRELPHAYKYRVLPKQTIHPGIENNLQDWLNENRQVRQFIIAGDCTDICVYLLALYLKTWSVKNDLHDNVVVPANCVETFDLAPAPGQDVDAKALPHPGEFLHRLFLYHMRTNGVRVVARID